MESTTPFVINLNRAIELIDAKREKDKNAVIRKFDEEPDLKVLNGRWGPYIAFKKKNYKIPKKLEADKLTLVDCLKIIENTPDSKSKRSRKK